ncbi:MAG TPA: hypothetical protein VFS64_04595 [Solirubrobacterales bacterium]|nr:hypothetical protein [Solirubrobacterales bacterium]
MGDEPFIRGVRAGIAILLGLAWVVLVIIGIAYSFKSGDDPSWLGGDGMKYFMPGLTTLVGGVVATAFGVAQSPDNPPATARLANLVEARKLDAAAARKWIGRGYVLAYLVLGAAAAVTWAMKGGEAVEFIRTLAPAWGGLVLPISTSFLNQT